MSPNAQREKPVERTQRRPAPGPNNQRLVEAVKPLSLAAPPADQVPGMELARLGRCVKAAKPFKSTIFSHVNGAPFASRSQCNNGAVCGGPSAGAGAGRDGA